MGSAGIQRGPRRLKILPGDKPLGFDMTRRRFHARHLKSHDFSYIAYGASIDSMFTNSPSCRICSPSMPMMP